MTGEFSGATTFGPGEPNQTILTSAGGFDIFITRYNPDGTLFWAKQAGGSGSDFGKGVTTLSGNSTVVAGEFSGIATFGPGEPNETILTSAGGFAFFIARYNPDGTLVWAKQAGGEYSGVMAKITTLSDNSTVVTGGFMGSATFGPGESNETILTSIGNRDIFIAHYNPDGTLAWAKRAGGGSGNWHCGNGITALSDDSTVVTGIFDVTATFGLGEINETVLTSAGGYDIFIARYNPTGTLAWAKWAGSMGTDEGGFAVTTISDDSTVVTGTVGPATFGAGEPNETILTTAGDEDIFIARYNPNGTLAWVKLAGGSGWDEGRGITTLSDDSTVVTGHFPGGSAAFGAGEPNQTVLTSGGGGDIFVARYEP